MPTTTSITCMNPDCIQDWEFSILRKQAYETGVGESIIDELHNRRVERLYSLESEYMKRTYIDIMREKAERDLEEAKRRVQELSSVVHRRDNIGRRRAPTRRGLSEEQIRDVAELRSLIREFSRNLKIWQGHGGQLEDPIIGRCSFQDCNGYITKSEWRCQTCRRITCSRCSQVIRGDNHVCNPDDIRSMHLIRSTTRECPTPGCGALIQKAHARDCDDMWCVNCNTAFKYSTGEIIKTTGSYHNTHHDEFLRRLNDPSLIDRGYNCFIRGEFSEEDIQYAPNDPQLRKLMTDVLWIDNKLEEHDTQPYGIEVLDKFRRDLIKRSRSIDDEDIKRQVMRIIKMNDLQLERRLEYHTAIQHASVILKDMIQTIQVEIRDNGSYDYNDVREVIKIFLEYLEELDAIYSLPRVEYGPDWYIWEIRDKLEEMME